MKLVLLFAMIICSAAHVGPSYASPREIRFSWTPPGGPPASYRFDNPEDQHRLILFPGMKKGGTYPIVVAFHGQPKRGVNPRAYKFIPKTIKIVGQMIESKEIPPVVLVLPVFRFRGQNWPKFDVKAFRKETEQQLTDLEITSSQWLVFGHSGAAGCGGDGMNRAHRMNPKAVGFFDTCLGRGWQDETRQLDRKKIQAVNIHSVETAGFRPKQVPEYQSNFDFGRAFGPLGLKPTPCPSRHPGKKLRDQPYRCAATPGGTTRAFVVDTGDGLEAHKALLEVAVRYFLKTLLGKSA